jgi:hypothetical protein
MAFGLVLRTGAATGSPTRVPPIPLLAEAHWNFNSFRGGPLADTDFALEHEPLFHHEHFLQHRDNGDTILCSDLRRRAAHRLIQFDRENLRFLPLENSANKLLDGFGMGDDADLAGRHRPLVDSRPLLKQGQCLGPSEGHVQSLILEG